MVFTSEAATGILAAQYNSKEEEEEASSRQRSVVLVPVKTLVSSKQTFTFASAPFVHCRQQVSIKITQVKKKSI